MSTDSYIADIIVGNDKRPMTILETNPFGISDPCLFEQYSNFDGKTWWRKNGGIEKL
jgi:hypothetical protein